MEATQEPAYLSTTQVARLFGCDRSTITRWVKSGRLPVAVQVPGTRGSYLFDRAVITYHLGVAGQARQTA